MSWQAVPSAKSKSTQKTIVKELNRLCELGMLEFQPTSEWVSPSCITPKKDNTVSFISDFREVEKRLVRKPFPIPKNHHSFARVRRFHFCYSP
jgi:hypothetical protein